MTVELFPTNEDKITFYLQLFFLFISISDYFVIDALYPILGCTPLERRDATSFCCSGFDGIRFH